MTTDHSEKWKILLAQNLFTTLQGMRAEEWFRELIRNRCMVPPAFWPRLAMISLASLVNSLYASAVDRRFRADLNQTRPRPPLFILGHWRSGTTYLQRLLAQDVRFGYPNFYQVLFPRGFLLSEQKNSPLYEKMLPSKRLFDNMANGMREPAEDEFALCSMTGLSPYMAWTFPNQWDYYSSFLDFRSATAVQRQHWASALDMFLRRLTLHWGDRPIVLKSPPHTARLKLLSELYPDAKFIHIHRHPWAVYQSTKRMLETFLKSTQLQGHDWERLPERIIEQYQTMHQAFFDDMGQLSEGRIIDVAFEELELQPLSIMERIYRELDLPSWDNARACIADYLKTQQGYTKNEYGDMSQEIRQRLGRAWAESFSRWGYTTS